jgi:hypothetical protein
MYIKFIKIYIMDITKLFFFDIETCGKYATFEDYYKNDERGAELFEYKYKKKLRKKDGDWGDDPDTAFLNQSPLLCEHGKIICLSMAYYKKDGSLTISSLTQPEEQLIKEAQKIFMQVDKLGLKLCGYNIKGFDMPWLFKKMCMYGLEIPKCISSFEKKPWEINVLDIADVWKGSSYEMTTFDEVAYSLGVPSPKDGAVNGSKVHDFYWNKKDLPAIATYCEKDVMTLVEICKKLEKIL